jgi:hypothetical protein
MRESSGRENNEGEMRKVVRECSARESSNSNERKAVSGKAGKHCREGKKCEGK